jgi:hypothetical protein
MEKNIVLERSIAIALRIVSLYRHLTTERKEFALSRELMLAGTSVGRHVKKAVLAQSREIYT